MKNIKKKIKKKLKYLFSKISFLTGYSINITRYNKLLKNVFKTKFNKNVLISYILDPFLYGIKYSHTNYMECYTAAESFKELGFNVDVVNFMNECTIDFRNYDVVYGFGHALENSFYSEYAENIIKIYYSTGACPFFWNKESTLRILNFKYNKKKIIPQSGRLVEYFWPLQLIMSDYNICLGNQFMANTYLNINPNLNIRTLNNFFYDVYDIDLSKKDYNESKNHFLWFGSAGLIHKGLDILIDIFSERNDIVLHICGASKNEIKFFKYYKQIIKVSKNIIDHGFINIESDDFKHLMNNCVFVLLPSAAEGQPGSILNVMANGGLIPIVSEASGLDVYDYGYILKSIEKENIINIINKILLLTERELYDKSLKTKSVVREEYSYQKYKENIKKYLSDAEKIEISNGILKEYSNIKGLLEQQNKSNTISIIIPCYKHAKYLKQCLKSVTNQTTLPNKLIIVNDASPDNTDNIVSDFIRKNTALDITYITNEDNKGQAFSINRAIKEINTDLYMILNDDDYLLPYAVEYQLMIFRENPDIHLSGASCYYVKNDIQIKRILSKKITFKNTNIRIHTPEECWNYKRNNDLNMTHSSSVFTRQAWEHVCGYISDKNKRVVSFSDRDFQLRINACCMAGSNENIKLCFWRKDSSVDAEIDS